MTNKKLYLSLSFLLLIILHSHMLPAQCVVTASADHQVVCSGDNISLSAQGECYLMYNDFTNGIGTGWYSTTANPVFTNPCGYGPNGTHLWVGTTPSQSRTLVTVDYDVSTAGCVIEWWMRYGRSLTAGDCEDPDEQNEGVHMQWSTNSGTSWHDFPGPNQNPVGTNSITPPFQTTTPGSGGYWVPPLNGTHNGNYPPIQSIYYWHKYSNDIPFMATTTQTRFRWAQLSTSNQSYDAWGIDEVSIKCPNNYLNVVWDHGPTLLNPPPVTLPNTTAAVYDTCFIVTISDSINSATDSVCITVNPAPSSDFGISETSTCSGETFLVYYSGIHEPSSVYNWNFDGTQVPGMGPHQYIFNSAGNKTISLEVTNSSNGCSSQTTQILPVHPNPSVSFFPDPISPIAGDTIYFTNMTSPSHCAWVWSFGDGNTSYLKNPFHIFQSVGVFNVSLEAITPYGCRDSLINISISVKPGPNGIEDNPASEHVRLYPIPATDKVFLDISTKSINQIPFVIYSMEGKKIITGKLSNKKAYKIDISSLNAGSYLLKCYINDNVVEKKFVKM